MGLGGHWAIVVHRETMLDLITLGKCEVPYIKSQYSLCKVIILYKTGDSRVRTNFCLRAIVCKNNRCLLDDNIKALQI